MAKYPQNKNRRLSLTEGRVDMIVEWHVSIIQEGDDLLGEMEGSKP